ncbi:MAG: hypothetical protein JWM63_1611 [Gammaproteobacteria bacterium]|jgi:hypothetical protein|nr:hypothetical protein [Gammaproteobacteria bacterium]
MFDIQRRAFYCGVLVVGYFMTTPSAPHAWRTLTLEPK